jgi:hypothetical protein
MPTIGLIPAILVKAVVFTAEDAEGRGGRLKSGGKNSSCKSCKIDLTQSHRDTEETKWGRISNKSRMTKVTL